MLIPTYIADAVPAYASSLAMRRAEAENRTLPRWQREAALFACVRLEVHLRAMAETLIALNDRPSH